MARIACLAIKDFSLAALIRANPDLQNLPFAVTHGHGPRAELTIITHTPAADRAAADALVDVAQSLSPTVEEDEPGRIYMALDGMGTLFSSERDLALEAVRRARSVGLNAEVGIAASKEVAA